MIESEQRTYGAVFLRMHPTGKAVLSLTEASQDQEGSLADLAARELGIPPEDIKVVHGDEDRFGVGHSYRTEPSADVGENVAATARKLRERAALIAAWMLDAEPDALEWQNGQWTADGDPARSVKIQAVALRAFAGDSLPDGVEGSLDAQTTYRVAAAEGSGAQR